MQRIRVTGGTPETAPADPVRAASDVRTSPDGRQTVTLNKANRRSVLLLVTDKTGNKKAVAKLPNGGELGAHPWSPDGKRIAFVSYQMP